MARSKTRDPGTTSGRNRRISDMKRSATSTVPRPGLRPAPRPPPSIAPPAPFSGARAPVRARSASGTAAPLMAMIPSTRRGSRPESITTTHSTGPEEIFMHRTTLIAGMFVAILSASALQAAAPRKAPQNGPYSWSTGAYQYDAAGNVTAIGVNTFTYDPLSRLAGSHVEAPDSESDQTYIYDPFGNLIRVTTSGIPTDITTSTATNHVDIAAYDDSGSVSQLQPPNSAYVYGFHYDALDALSEETVDGAPASYFVYTASDERLRIERGNVVHWRIRGLRPKVARDIQRSGSTWSVDRDYFYRGGSPLAAMTPTTIEHFTLDALESPRLLTNASGAQLAVHTYLPFGRELGRSEEHTPALQSRL